MMTDDNLRFENAIEFGPYDRIPAVYISHEKNRYSLVRTIYEENNSDEKPIDKNPQKFKDIWNKMTKWQRLGYFIFLYNPPKTENKTKERKVLGIETMLEGASNFSIEERNKKYYVLTK